MSAYNSKPLEYLCPFPCKKKINQIYMILTLTSDLVDGDICCDCRDCRVVAVETDDDIDAVDAPLLGDDIAVNP